jgi:hypothetical protein
VATAVSPWASRPLPCFSPCQPGYVAAQPPELPKTAVQGQRSKQYGDPVNGNPRQGTNNSTIDPYELKILAGREFDLPGCKIS